MGFTKYCAEGQITCGYCDSDYCAADGKEKISGTDAWLTRYVVPKVVKKKTTTNSTKKVITQKIDPTVNVSGIQIKKSSLKHVVNNIERWIF